jgi:hypothetical protein
VFVAASPPGWGSSGYRQWIAGMAVHLLGLFAGALALAAVLFGAGELVLHPPLWTLAALAAALALVAARVVPLELSGSRWRVPQAIGRLGPVSYVGAFGVALGTGVATRAGSPATYAMVAWGLVAPRWALVWPVFAAFAAGRALGFLAVAARSWRRGTYSAEQLWPVVSLARRLWPVEAALLAMLAVWLLAG